MAWVAYQRARFDEWFPFIRSQALWNRHLGGPWNSIGRAFSDLVHLRLLDTSTESIVELFDLVTVILLAVAAVIAFVRIRHSYGVLLGLAWCVFTFQTILQSQSRDVLVLFPFFAALGVWVTRHPWREPRPVVPVPALRLLPAGTIRDGEVRRLKERAAARPRSEAPWRHGT